MNNFKEIKRIDFLNFSKERRKQELQDHQKQAIENIQRKIDNHFEDLSYEYLTGIKTIRD